MSIPAEFIRNYFGVVHPGLYEKYADFGARWNRSDTCIWDIMAPGASFSFDKWDHEMQAAQAHGVTPFPLLGVNYTPAWATHEGVNRYPPRSIQQLREGVEALVRRTSRPPLDLTFFEVSNEPNIGWFWRTADPGEVHKVYIDQILIPTAEIIHRYGGKVVAPSITMEWPDNAWPARERPKRKCFSVAWSIKAIQDWLGYHDAWKHIDYFSLHYTKGDTEKTMVPYAENMMPLYDYLFDNWVRPGKIEGIWNTEEGLTAVEAGNVGEVALEPWEVPPYGQWVPRYTVPVIHWAIGRGWRDRDQYKVFWYNIRSGGALSPTSMVGGEDGREILDPGKAMGTLVRLFSNVETVDVYGGSVDVGFGLYPKDPAALNYFAPYLFTNYAFSVDRDLLVVAWMDLPGLETEGAPIQAVVNGLGGVSSVSSVVRTHYLTGMEEPASFSWSGDALHIALRRAPDPVVYFRVCGSGEGLV
ncbi:MAG: hypothetical protein V1800_17960 [Candidatus Latescibacterota bacterium]